MHVAMRHAGILLIIVASGLVGCGGGEGRAGEGSGTRAYLLMDPELRQEQGALELGGDHVSTQAALPVAVAPHERVVLRIGAERTSVEAKGGQLGWIHGPDGFIEWLSMPGETTGDALLVDASEASARELADLLSATAADHGAGLWELRATDLWERTSFLDPPEGVVEARPVFTSEEPPPPAPGDPRRGAPPLPSLPASSPAAALVGVYASEQGALILDAGGEFVLSRWRGSGSRRCSPDGAGTRGRYTYAHGVLELGVAGSPLSFVPSGSGLRAADGTVLSTLPDEVSP